MPAGAVDEVNFRSGRATGTRNPPNAVPHFRHRNSAGIFAAGNLGRVVVEREQVSSDLRGGAIAILEGAHLGAHVTEVDRAPAPVDTGLVVQQSWRAALGFTHRPDAPGFVARSECPAHLEAFPVHGQIALPVAHLRKARALHDEMAIVKHDALRLFMGDAGGRKQKFALDVVLIRGEGKANTPHGFQHLDRQGTHLRFAPFSRRPA